MSIKDNSYIGKKGYTVSKSLFTGEQLRKIQQDLNVKPIIVGGMGGKGDQTQTFPCYRESEKKLYLPRFYGIQEFGLPENNKLTNCDSIDIDFPNELRDYQKDIVDVYMKHCETPNGGILEVPCGKGKTVMALKIISLLKCKTIVIVHKEFLMNQWIERIEQFLPDAKIGKIQGSTFDIEGKDIVIGMLQTLYCRDFAPNVFDCFGLTIVDEVHRIGSEQFSKSLFKVVTKYMLGISATVERKDGLTQILYMFIGPRIYREETRGDDQVQIRALHYKSNDDEFNEVETDYTGRPKYSTMISKLCGFGPRSDFIVRVLNDLIIENPDKQIMILGHNKILLKYLHEAITHHAFASCGYYIGGMKQKDLQISETMQIVIATYAMAAEALDIKTLSTLVMVSPKTDVTQSIGRILRVKNNNPIVVDIVDAHSTFVNQWNTRRRYYKKNKYPTYSASSDNYINMTDTVWKTVYDPNKNVKEPVEGVFGGKCLLKIKK
jgi:superfamily II DNA or RNA helicase